MFSDEFARYNPITNVIFFFGAIIMGMFFIHPVFTGASFAASVIYLFVLKGRKTLKDLRFMFIVFVLLSLINPLFNDRGAHVLFTYFGRAYTLESLIYGMTLGAMAAGIIGWFSCYNFVMTSDKFIFLFGGAAPSLSLILSMIMRLVPNYTRKTKQIIAARKCIGMAGSASENKKEQIRNGTTALGALTGWALEGGIITADSMRCRGYGCGKRTGFAIYRYDRKNIILSAILVFFLGMTIFCAAKGAAYAVFMPVVDMSWFGNVYMMTGIVSYGIFLLVPVFLNLFEIIRWKILRREI